MGGHFAALMVDHVDLISAGNVAVAAGRHGRDPLLPEKRVNELTPENSSRECRKAK